MIGTAARRKHKPSRIITGIDQQQPFLISGSTTATTATRGQSPPSQSEPNSAPPNFTEKGLSRHRSRHLQPLLKRCIHTLTLFSPTSLTVAIHSQSHSPSPPMIINQVHTNSHSSSFPPSKSRWTSREFALYWIVLAYSLKLIISAAINLSQGEQACHSFFPV